MSPDSPSPSTASEWSHAEPSESCIIFDFDDTLFPTGHIADRCPKLFQALVDEFSRPCVATSSLGEHLDANVDRRALEECGCTAAAVLRMAASLGKVCVVTMAHRGWVEVCCKMLMPEVLEVMEELDIPIYYAREALLESHRQRALEEGLCIGQLCKERAMKRALRRFSAANRHSGLSADWWGVLSIGDCQAERLALQDVFMAGGAQGHCKTVKFINAPCLETLLGQLQILVAWLERLSTHDGDVDLCFDSLATEGDLCDLLP